MKIVIASADHKNGIVSYGSSWVRIYGDYITISVSENSVSFSISVNNPVDSYILVGKDTPEGSGLDNLFEKHKDAIKKDFRNNIEEIDNFILSIFVKQLSVESFKALIDRERQEAFEAGQEHKAASICKELGVMTIRRTSSVIKNTLHKYVEDK